MMPALAEQAETTADFIGSLRERLSGIERDRFDAEFMDARHESRSTLRHLLESWTITIMLRETPGYEEQYKDFVRILESEAM